MTAGVRTSLVFVVGLGLGAAAGIGAVTARNRAARRPVATAAVFDHVIRAIRSDFVDSLSDDELYVKAAKGVVNTLGDPYSAFLGPEEFRGYTNMLRGRGETVGLTVESGLTGLHVANVVAGTPADRAGIRPGDFVLEIGGRPARRWDAGRAAASLRPDAEGNVTVRFQSPGDSVPTEVTLAATAGRLPAVGSVVRLSDSVGYFALRTVSDEAGNEVREALSSLRAWELSGLIIDLRGNRGGRLDEGLRIADIFLPGGKQIGTVSKRRLRWGYASAHPEAYPRLRLTLLVDRNTASSAEIIAAALRDNGRAWLVGERTFGKGLIQTTIPLGDSIAVRLTTGRWQGPGGELLVGGLRPDSAIQPAAWTAAVLRSLEARMPVVSASLLAFARARVGQGTAADSARLTRDELERLRAGLRTAGLSLSRRTMVRHRAYFDTELARLVAAIGTPAEAVRFGLLADPAVATALGLLPRDLPPAGR
ncbi:MAG: S41 family peptidase [Gemmatimonadales bacterium]